MGSSTNQSAVSKNSKAYKASKKKFRENALAMDYTEEDEEENSKDNIETKISQISKEIRKKRK